MSRPRKSEPIDMAAVLKKLAMFQAVSAKKLEHIVSKSRQMALLKGMTLFEKGDPCNGFYVVVTGKIKLALPVGKQGERVVDIIGAGSSFGEALMFHARPYPLFAQALTECTLIHVAQEPVFELIGADPNFARDLLAGLSMRMHHLIMDIDTFSKQTGTQRLIGFIFQNLVQETSDAAGPIAFSFPTSKQLVASRLCLAPETLSRSLKELSSKNFIEVKGNQMIIKDLRGLRKYSLED